MSDRRRPRQLRIVRALPVIDDEFDAHLPEPLRVKSAEHFTPTVVARRAAELLAAPRARVLDVGAGVGKFCIVAAAIARDTTFVGVEQRLELVQVANRIIRELSLENVAMVHGDAFGVDWTEFDAFYFFNPFGEVRSVGRYRTEVDRTCDRLAEARVDTRVLTYHGFGAAPPRGYALQAMELIGTDRLALWAKES